MKIVHKKDYIFNRAEKLSQIDNVNRSGYVPLDVRYEEMRLAGIRLDSIRDYQYNYTYRDFLNSGKSISEFTSDQTLKTRFNSKQELDDLFKSKLEKYSQYSSNLEKVKALRKEYDEEMKEKAIREDAVRKYVESLKKDKTTE